MDSLYILIPIAVVFVAVAVGVFFWAVDNNQFDDLEGPAHSILFDEPTSKNTDKPKGPIAPVSKASESKAPEKSDKL